MAIRVVSIISVDTDIRKEIRNFGMTFIIYCTHNANIHVEGIKLIIDCLDDGDVDTIRSAVGALVNISVNDRNKVAILSTLSSTIIYFFFFTARNCTRGWGWGFG